jgi:hypothetical protein
MTSTMACALLAIVGVPVWLRATATTAGTTSV